MKRYSFLSILIILFAFSCSDDEVSSKGQLVIDDESFSMSKLIGQATLGSDYSLYELTIANSNAKIVDNEPTGTNVNFISFSFERNIVSSNLIPGTFFYDKDSENNGIDHLVTGIGYDSETENADVLIDEFNTGELTITKGSGSIYTVDFTGEASDGTEVTVTFKGKLTKLPDESDTAP